MNVSIKMKTFNDGERDSVYYFIQEIESPTLFEETYQKLVKQYIDKL